MTTTDLAGAFLAAFDAGKALAGDLTCQIAVAGDGKSRLRRGCWDSEEALAQVQAQDDFQLVAAGCLAVGPCWGCHRATEGRTAFRHALRLVGDADDLLGDPAPGGCPLRVRSGRRGGGRRRL